MTSQLIVSDDWFKNYYTLNLRSKSAKEICRCCGVELKPNREICLEIKSQSGVLVLRRFLCSKSCEQKFTVNILTSIARGKNLEDMVREGMFLPPQK